MRCELAFLGLIRLAQQASPWNSIPTILLSEEDVRSVLDMKENLEALDSAYKQEAMGAASYRPKATVYVGGKHGFAMTHVTSLGGLRNPPVVVINIRSMLQATSESRDIHKLQGPHGTFMSMLRGSAKMLRLPSARCPNSIRPWNHPTILP